jgi:L-lactate utilization protein LutB
MSTAILDDADIAEVLAQLDAFKLKYTKQTYSDNIKNIIENFDKKRKINVEEARTKFKEFTNVMDSVRKTDLSKLDERFKKYL